MKLLKYIVVSAAFMSLSSCSFGTRLYDWRNYENDSYRYTKDPSEKNETALFDTYTKIIDEPRGSRKMPPPGICAEMGYIYVKNGEKDKALRCFEKEIEYYPESTVFMKRIIDSLK